MIMKRGSDQLLLPVNPIFIIVSLMLAFGFNTLPLGRVAYMPDLVALTLAFWCVHQPRRVGVGIAFMLGLLMDVNMGALLGQHALSYSLLAYFAIAMHRRLLWFSPLKQALQVFLLLLAARAIAVAVRMAAGGMFPGWEMAWGPVIEALLWPLASLLLLAPQRRAPNPDQNRPI
jgi:rod shape-determining protein MreD